MFEQLSHKICVAILSVMLLSAFTACIHDGEGQTAAAPDYKLHFNISTEGKWTDGSRYTRGTFLNEPEDGIGIFGYNYAGEWDEDKSSTLFYNDQLIGFGSEWMTSGNYVIPYGINNPNRNLRFFAHPLNRMRKMLCGKNTCLFTGKDFPTSHVREKPFLRIPERYRS